MADINVMLPAKLIHVGICQQKGLEVENSWVEKQFNKLTPRQQAKWSLKKLRNYFLDCYCDEAAIEKKLAEITTRRAI